MAFSNRSLRTLDLNLLPVFDVLMQQQHLSRAAEQLSMSQPAVSGALKRLREKFEDPLFIRTAHGLRPTAKALMLQQQLQPALAQIHQAWQPDVFDPASSNQHFSIVTNAATEFMLAPQLIGWLRQSAPQMTLQLLPEQTSDIAGKMKQGTVDFVIDFVGYDPQQFQKTLLTYEKLTLICNQQHPKLAAQQTISQQQFEQLPQVSLIPRVISADRKLLGLSHERQGTPFQQLMGQQLPKRNLKAFVSSFIAIPQIIAASDLIAVVPQSIAKIHQQHIKQFPLPFEYPAVPIYLQWHHSREKDSAHLWLRESITSLARQFHPE